MTEAVKAANEDTPPGVTVPNAWAGLAMWVAGRWGIGIPVAGVFGYFLITVYTDFKASAGTSLEIVRSMMEIQQANVRAIDAFAGAVQANTAEMKANTAEIKSLRDDFRYGTKKP